MTVAQDQLFCRNQIWCVDADDGKPGPACGAHLNEGHVFLCRYNSLDEARRGAYPCLDAESIKEMP